MSKDFYQIQIKKGALKFAAAHMTVFPNGKKEALHGHNYQVAVKLDVRNANLKKMTSFGDVKKIIAEVCHQWDEKVLLATRCKYYRVTRKSQKEIDFKLCGKRYALPTDEVELISVENITTELLAEEFAKRIQKQIRAVCKKSGLRQFEVLIEESPGQGASFTVHF